MHFIKYTAKHILRWLYGKSITVNDYANFERKIVTFDVFDTLVLRGCDKPADVFDIVAMRYNKNHDAKIHGFRESRMHAEYMAREQKADGEVTLDNIYTVLSEGIDSKVAQELKLLEIDTELSVCKPNPEIVELYRYLRDAGTRIFIISDMYLPKNVVADILNKCGITGYERLYVSGELGVTKRDGRLFEQVIRENGLDRKNMIHIGDHPLSDYLIPKKYKISAWLYKNKKHKIDFPLKELEHLTDEEKLQMMLLQNCVDTSFNTTAEKIGNQILGPMLYGFSTWLHEWLIKNHISQVCFLSREGAIMKKAYEMIYPDGQIETQYLNVSRLAVSRASAVHARCYKDLEEIFASLLREVNSVSDFIELIGLQKEESFILKEIGADKKALLDTTDKDKLYDAIIKHEKAYFEKQNRLFTEYLEERVHKDDIIALVDIGWVGTMQFCIQKFLDGSNVVGNYIAVSNLRKRQDYQNLVRRGYWCCEDEWDRTGRVIRYSMSCIETLFMGDEGSTLEYVLEEERVIPIKDISEVTGMFRDFVLHVQSAAVRYWAACAKTDLYPLTGEIPSYVAMSSYVDFAKRSYKRCMALWKEISVLNGIYKFSFVPEKSLFYYMFHFGELKKEALKNNSKIIFFKGLFKVPLPYYKICCLLDSGLGIKTDYAKKISRMDQS